MRILFIISLFLLMSCRINDNKVVSDDDRPLVVVTTNLLADVVQNIVKDSLRVESLMGEGVDPHLYKASIGDLRKLLNADIIFYQGLHLEGKLGEVLDKLSRTKNVMALADQISPDQIRYVDERQVVPDPHIWFDVRVWKEVVESACSKLSEELPSHASYFRANTNQYLKELDQLDGYIRDQVRLIDLDKRVLITSHD